MIRKRLEEITWQDIEELVTNRVGESKTLEFKCQLPGHGNDEKKETVRDIASFANASGGDLVYGIEEFAEGANKGRAKEILPIVGVSADKEKQRLDNMLRNGLAPPVAVQMREIYPGNNEDGGFVLVVRISQSLLAPHMVTLGDSYRFFSRTSSGKFPMKDVGEIRNAFLASESQGERVRNFIRMRLNQILADDTTLPLLRESRLVLHAVPVMSYLSSHRFDFSHIDDVCVAFAKRGQVPNNRYNLDGILMYSMGSKPNANIEACQEYTQLYFHGSVEYVWTFQVHPDQNGCSTIGIDAIERKLIEKLSALLEGFRKFEIQAPLVVSVAMLSCKGTVLRTDRSIWHFNEDCPLDRDSIITTPIVIESLDLDSGEVLRPLCDAIWNAYGYAGSLNFSDDGKWTR